MMGPDIKKAYHTMLNERGKSALFEKFAAAGTPMPATVR
jgi:hypothetical protein